jgi:C4-dicarboxylate transporter DctM subunit
MNASGGSIGPIIPPSITSVVIGYTCNISIGAMFAGSFIPGILVGISLMVASYIHTHSKKSTYVPELAFSLRRLGRATFEALPALFAPVVIVGGILGGIFTATEAAAVAVFYGLLVGMFVYRELSLADLPPMLLRVASQSAMILFIAANASLFAWLVAVEQIPQLVTGWITAISNSPAVFLLVVNIVLLITGCLMETIAAIIILMPILFPVATYFGINPVHFGVMVTVNLCIGMVTPPYGIALYVASAVSGRSVAQVTRHLALPIVAMVVVLLLITYYSESVLIVPRIAGFIK